ncbi:MAG: TM2 domain-containing protein [Gemmatimonadota bacterium]
MYRDSIGYALWCLFFVGLCGVHRIYLGKYGTGILWLFTFGLFGIGQFIDLFQMKNLVREANVREGYLLHPRFARQLEATRQSLIGAEPENRRIMRVLLSAAAKNGGKLSVTQGVAATGLTFSEVEKVLTEMLVEGYVDVDNEPRTGVVIYRFPELAGPADPLA